MKSEIHETPRTPSVANTSEATSQQSTRKLIKDLINQPQKHLMEVRHAAFSVMSCFTSIMIVSLQGYMFSRAGLLTFAFIAMFTAALNFFSYYTIVKTEEILKVQSYYKMIDGTLGSRWKPVAFLFNGICFISCSFSNLVFLKKVFPQLIVTFFPNAPQTLTQSSFWAICIMEAVLFPLSLLRKFKGVSYISFFTSLLPFILFFASILFLVFQGGQPDLSTLPVTTTNFSHILEVYSIHQYSYLVQPYLQQIFDQLRHPTLRRKMTALGVAYVLGMSQFFAVAICHCIIFLKDRDLFLQIQNVFRMERFLAWLPIRILILIFSLSCFTAVIISDITLKLQLFQFFPRLGRNRCGNLFTTLIITQFVLLCTILIDKVSVAVRISSILLYPLMSYIIPAIVFIKAYRQSTCRAKACRALAVILVIWIVLFVCYSCYYAVVELI